MKKILHVVGHLGNGGDSKAIINILDYIKYSKLENEYKFDFLTHDGYNEDVVKKLRGMNINIYVLPKDARLMGPFTYYKKISKILREKKYDAIHMHTSFQSFVGLIAAKKNKINVRICHSHTSDTIRKTSFLSRKFILPVCRILINIFATKKVCCSRLAGEFLFGNHACFDILYNGIDINKIRNFNYKEIANIKKKYNITNSTIVIGQVGRFDDNKNQLFTIELSEKLANNKYVFFLIGEGETLPDIKKIVEAKKLNNIYFTGRIDDVNNYMSFFDFLLLPSKYGEGLPVTLIEQQIVSSKCVCISSDIVTVEANLGNVEYVPLNNKERWIKIIKTKKITNKKIVFDEFDINNTSKQWLNLY